MKKNTNNSNNKNVSARRKLIPAVAMLATSAAMLSTSTYAWFTMSKEVEVTGLSMSATAGDSLEISLGKLDGNSGGGPSIDPPTYNDSSWKSAIAINDYYASVGKLKPASSKDGLKIYSVDNQAAYAGGTKVYANATVSEQNQGGSATLELDSTNNTPFTVSTNSDDEGYYIDVPMWIRTIKTQNTPVYCTVNISDKSGSSAVGDLKKAVRVAIVPIGNATSNADGTSDNIGSLDLPGSANYTGDSTDSATLTDLTTPVLFGLDQSTYNLKVLGSSGQYSASTVAAPTISTDATSSNAYTSGTSKNTQVFSIPAATSGQYSGVSFVARIWLEGESTFCNDANAAQDWNIDFHFTLDSVPAPTGP